MGDYLLGFKFRETFLIFRGLVSAGYWFSREREDYNAASKDPAFRDGGHVFFYIQKDQAFLLPLFMFLAHKVS